MSPAFFVCAVISCGRLLFPRSVNLVVVVTDSVTGLSGFGFVNVIVTKFGGLSASAILLPSSGRVSTSGTGAMASPSYLSACVVLTIPMLRALRARWRRHPLRGEQHWAGVPPCVQRHLLQRQRDVHVALLHPGRCLHDAVHHSTGRSWSRLAFVVLRVFS